MVIPIYRIFDEAKAREFYLDWLGFKVDWEHRFEENAPLYMQISKTVANGEIVLHLSEHHGDASPGSNTFIEFQNLKEFHSELIAKKYKYNRPGLEVPGWDENSITMTVNDPFHNRIVFRERVVAPN